MASSSGTQVPSRSESDGYMVAPRTKERSASELTTGVELGLWVLVLSAIVFVPAAELETRTPHAFRPWSFISALVIVAVFGSVLVVGTWIVSRDVGVAIRLSAAVTFAMFWWGMFVTPSKTLAARIPFFSADIALVLIVAVLCIAILLYGRFTVVARAAGDFHRFWWSTAMR